MYALRYLETASQLFRQYEARLPLAEFLKLYFKQHRKHGSRDRRFIVELLYGAYRLGPQSEEISLHDRMVAGAFLSNRLPDDFFFSLKPEWLPMKSGSTEERMHWFEQHTPIRFIHRFPLTEGLSEHAYRQHLFSKPGLFIRVRKNRKEIEARLQQQGISFHEIGEHGLQFEHGTRLQDILPASDYVVQDWASQQCGFYLQGKEGESWWDCCAGSGGKSILLLDQSPPVQLLVSDKRKGIINNLHLRMKQYGYTGNYRSEIIDLEDPDAVLPEEKFDVILADVPCSGSGTWARSPEQYYFATMDMFYAYQKMQWTILQRVFPKLKPGGRLLYITCSVCRIENEEMVAKAETHFNVKSSTSTLLNAFPQGGDALFVHEFLMS